MFEKKRKSHSEKSHNSRNYHTLKAIICLYDNCVLQVCIDIILLKITFIIMLCIIFIFKNVIAKTSSLSFKNKTKKKIAGTKSNQRGFRHVLRRHGKDQSGPSCPAKRRRPNHSKRLPGSYEISSGKTAVKLWNIVTTTGSFGRICGFIFRLALPRTQFDSLSNFVGRLTEENTTYCKRYLLAGTFTQRWAVSKLPGCKASSQYFNPTMLILKRIW